MCVINENEIETSNCVIREVKKNIKEYKLVEPGDTLVVGVSGGPDSVCLLHALNLLKDEYKLILIAIHINHLLRGKEAAEDETFVKILCDKLRIKCYLEAHDIRQYAKDNRLSIEEAAREVRYERFAFYLNECGAKKIVVAHNKNDQVETVLMNIIRGAGLDGLCGMEFEKGKIIRPLLSVERKDIIRYCIEKKLEPRYDSSNMENIYTRNKVRNKLIPFIDGLFEADITESVFRMSSLLKTDKEVIKGRVLEAYEKIIEKENNNEIYVNIEKINLLEKGIKKGVIRFVIKKIKGNLKSIENKHIENMLNFIESAKTGAIMQLPTKIIAEKSYNIIKIFSSTLKKEVRQIHKKQIIIGENIKIEGYGELQARFEEIGYKYQNYIMPANSLVQYFDYDKLKCILDIRGRKEGDIFKPLNSSGTKKLKKYFIDEKIPRGLRDEMLLVAVNNEIVWLIGYKISNKFKVTKETQNLLKLKFKKYASDG